MAFERLARQLCSPVPGAPRVLVEAPMRLPQAEPARVKVREGTMGEPDRTCPLEQLARAFMYVLGLMFTGL